jgi:hypothetical protein
MPLIHLCLRLMVHGLLLLRRQQIEQQCCDVIIS